MGEWQFLSRLKTQVSSSQYYELIVWASVMFAVANYIKSHSRKNKAQCDDFGWSDIFFKNEDSQKECEYGAQELNDAKHCHG